MAAKKKRAKKAVEQKSAVRQFTTRQRRLIDCYAGDIKKAASKAGLSYDCARRLVTKSHILEAIKNRQDTEVRPKNIADRQERQQFWTQIMRDTQEDARDRLKASDLLGKSETDFKAPAVVDQPDSRPETVEELRQALEEAEVLAKKANIIQRQVNDRVGCR